MRMFEEKRVTGEGVVVRGLEVERINEEEKTRVREEGAVRRRREGVLVRVLRGWRGI